MSKRFESGASKRKKQKEVIKLQNKLPKLTKYFTSNQSENEISVETHRTSSNIENKFPNNEMILTDSDLDSDNDNNVFNELFQDETKNSGAIKESVKNNIGIVHNDPAFWPSELNTNERERNKYLNEGYSFFQNKNSDFFKSSKREYSVQNRYFSYKYFNRVLSNGEKCERKWIMYSELSGSIFCYFCKLFSSDTNNVFIKEGFSNWKKADEVICNHENSKEHCRCMLDWFNFMQKSSHVDKKMISMMREEQSYWTEVLKRVVAAIRFLSERGLAFRGTNEVFGSKNCGNYLGVLELLAEFDPLLKQHISVYANKGQASVSYLSKTICEELIHLMAQRILQQIIIEIKEAKYWGLIVDSTPDISHSDQLSVIFRYYFKGNVHERFFSFLQIKSHTGKALCNEILDLLEQHGLKVADCRAQTYDNASNMPGKYCGLQALIREQNKLAFYVPCVGHSLNLVGECSVDECICSINYFSLLRNLNSFFTASTHRWNVLKKQNSKLKSLSTTRWSSRAEASKDFVENFDGIFNALDEIINDKEQKSDTRHEAQSYQAHMVKLENVFMAVLWDRILKRFNSTSKFLQKIELDLNIANNMLKSLIEFVKQLRGEFLNIEADSKELSSYVQQEYTFVKKRDKTRKLCDGQKETENLDKTDEFRIKTFYVIIDKLVTELTKRSEAYNFITGLFGFLSYPLTMHMSEIKVSAKKLIEVYSEDLDSRLVDEYEQFIPLLKLQSAGMLCNENEQKNQTLCLSPLKVLNWIVDSHLIDVFPNIYISYRLFLTIPIANCESERSFSVLKRIKNMYRSTMLNDIINEFAERKCRKKFFV